MKLRLFLSILATCFAPTWAGAQADAEPEPVVVPIEEAPVDEMLDGPVTDDVVKPAQVFDRRVAARVSAEFVELQKGPGPAYSSSGRSYQNDQVLVKQRSGDGRWYQIEAGGILGWVRTSDVELVREQVRRGRDGKTDAGRDRRQTNYRYDDSGRRISTTGDAVGSGEGTGDKPESSKANQSGDPWESFPEPGAGARPPSLHVTFGAGVAQISRDFASNIVADGQGASALSKLNVASTAVSYALGVLWAPHDAAFGAAVRFRDSRFTDTTIPANANFGFQRPVTLTMDAQTFDAELHMKYRLNDFAIGGYAGLRVFRQAFQQTRPYPLFVTNLYTSLGGGLLATGRFGAFDLTAQGGVVLPLSVSQDPLGSGDPTGIGFDGQVRVAYAFSPQWAVYVDGHLQQLDFDFSGPSAHVDNVTADAPRAYTQAKEKDRVVGAGVGVRWSL